MIYIYIYIKRVTEIEDRERPKTEMGKFPPSPGKKMTPLFLT